MKWWLDTPLCTPRTLQQVLVTSSAVICLPCGLESQNSSFYLIFDDKKEEKGYLSRYFQKL